MRSAALVDGMHGGLMVKPCWQLCLFDASRSLNINIFPVA